MALSKKLIGKLNFFKIINPLHYTKGSLTYNLKKGTNKIDLAKKGHENN